jgi:hypothetical protein
MRLELSVPIVWWWLGCLIPPFGGLLEDLVKRQRDFVARDPRRHSTVVVQLFRGLDDRDRD